MPSSVTSPDKVASERAERREVCPHFNLDRRLTERVVARAQRDSIQLSDVLRFAIARYAEDAPEQEPEISAAALLPEEGLKTLREVWKTNSPPLINSYLAALFAAGWSNRAIADSVVACGAKEKMTRQAVSLRVKAAPEDVPPLPDVPTLGPRRTTPVVPAKPKNRSRVAGKKPQDTVNTSFRCNGADFDAAKRRATAEGAMMTAVLEDAMADYASGQVKKRQILKSGSLWSDQ